MDNTNPDETKFDGQFNFRTSEGDRVRLLALSKRYRRTRSDTVKFLLYMEYERLQQSPLLPTP